MRDREAAGPQPPADQTLRLPQVSTHKGLSLVSLGVGALPIVNEFLRRLRLREFLAAYLPVKDRRARVSPALGILVLLRNVLLSREPIYGVGEWASSMAPDLLELSPRQMRHLNDDRVGRCLDRLFDGDRTSLLLSVVGRAVKEFEIGLDQLHCDSTTVTFFGSYERAREPAFLRGKTTLAITHGHNKDHRPDLKQLLFILTVSDDGAVPVHFTAADGNTTDDQTHRATWDLLCKIAGRRDFLYVADSKLATTENMAHIHERGGRFVTVLPRTRAETDAFLAHVQEHPVTWREIHRRTNPETGKVLDVFSVAEHPSATAEGHRLLWYFSTAKLTRDQQARRERIEDTTDDLCGLRERLGSKKTRFREPGPVHAAVEEILRSHETSGFFRVEVHEVAEESFRQQRPGRPSKNTPYRRTTRSRFGLSFELDHQAIECAAKADGTFPLVTNDKDLSAQELLLAYKDQARVEQRHHHLKGVHQVAPVFLKGVGRIEALLTVYFLALLVHALLERQLRMGMLQAGVDALLLYPERRPCKAPSTARVLEIFQHIQRHELWEGGRLKATLKGQLSPLHHEILKLLGIPPATYTS